MISEDIFPYRDGKTTPDDLGYWLRPADHDLGNAFLRRTAYDYQRRAFDSFDNMVYALSEIQDDINQTKYLSREQLHLWKVAVCVGKMVADFYKRFGPGGQRVLELPDERSEE